MKRSLLVFGAAVILAAGFTGIAVANQHSASQLTGMTGCLSSSGSLADLAIGDNPLSGCDSNEREVSIPVLEMVAFAQQPSLNCVVKKGAVSWDKSGVWAEFEVEWKNIESGTKAILRWDAEHPAPSSPSDNSLSKATGDWTYEFNDSTSAGFTVAGPSGSGRVRLHLGSGNGSSAGTTSIIAMTWFPPDGSFACVTGG